MLIDITLKITPQMIAEAQSNEKKTFSGHIGTHFDCMNKAFPLEYTERKSVIFDVSKVQNRDIEVNDINLNDVKKDMFVVFYSGYIEKEKYGTEMYFKNHPQLSNHLIEELLKKDISIIGIDFSGMRRGKEHPLKDQQCADKNVFVVENLCNLKEILKFGKFCKISTYPLSLAEASGLPCRVIAKI